MRALLISLGLCARAFGARRRLPVAARPLQLPSFRQASADVPDVEFFWRDVCAVPARDLAYLRERVVQQDAIQKYLRGLEKQFGMGGQ